LRGKTFKNLEDARKSIEEYFNSKDEEFFRRGIHDLPNRWKKVVAANGNYFD
jgi:general stress protein 26